MPDSCEGTASATVTRHRSAVVAENFMVADDSGEEVRCSRCFVDEIVVIEKAMRMLKSRRGGTKRFIARGYSQRL